MSVPIALQLWSVAGDCAADFFGTLEKVAKMGYDGVEFAGYHGKSASEIKAKLDELGLKVAGSHVPYQDLINKTDEVIEFALAIGNKNVVFPYIVLETESEWLNLAKELEKIAPKFAEAGLTFLYHNHDHEFKKIGDEFALDILIRAVGKAEIDTYWAEFSGVNAVEYLQKYDGLAPLVHIKDMADCRTKSTEVGNGVLDIAKIADQAIKAGAQWLIVEQEAFTELPPIEAVALCLQNLKEILVAN